MTSGAPTDAEARQCPLGSVAGRHPHHLGQMVGLFIEPPVLFPQRSDGIGQFVHAFGACAQQYFEPVGVAFFV